MSGMRWETSGQCSLGYLLRRLLWEHRIQEIEDEKSPSIYTFSPWSCDYWECSFWVMQTLPEHSMTIYLSSICPSPLIILTPSSGTFYPICHPMDWLFHVHQFLMCSERNPQCCNFLCLSPLQFDWWNQWTACFMRNPHDENFSHFSLYELDGYWSGISPQSVQMGLDVSLADEASDSNRIPMSQDRVQGSCQGTGWWISYLNWALLLSFAFLPTNQSSTPPSQPSSLLYHNVFLLLFPKRLPLLLLCWDGPVPVEVRVVDVSQFVSYSMSSLDLSP